MCLSPGGHLHLERHGKEYMSFKCKKHQHCKMMLLCHMGAGAAGELSMTSAAKKTQKTANQVQIADKLVGSCSKVDADAHVC